MLLVAATLVANRDVSIVVATRPALLGLEQCCHGLTFMQARGYNLDDRAATGRGGFDFNQCHVFLPY
jgi:hypothetical protein